MGPSVKAGTISGAVNVNCVNLLNRSRLKIRCTFPERVARLDCPSLAVSPPGRYRLLAIVTSVDTEAGFVRAGQQDGDGEVCTDFIFHFKLVVKDGSHTSLELIVQGIEAETLLGSSVEEFLANSELREKVKAIIADLPGQFV